VNVLGIDTEGLYRIPGSMRRIKDWVEKFEKAGRESVPVPITDIADGEDGSHTITREKLPPSTMGPIVDLRGESTPTVASLIKRCDIISFRFVFYYYVFFFSLNLMVFYSLICSVCICRYLSRIPTGFLGDGFWTDLDIFLETLREDSNIPPEGKFSRVKTFIRDRLPSRCHWETMSFFFHHLNRVTLVSAKNMMTPRNLQIVIFPSMYSHLTHSSLEIWISIILMMSFLIFGA
jgi:hypothetical protein